MHRLKTLTTSLYWIQNQARLLPNRLSCRKNEKHLEKIDMLRLHESHGK